MELFFAVAKIMAGGFIALVGFKVIKKKFNGEDALRKEEEWYKSYGLFFKIGGVFLLARGLMSLVELI